MIQSTVDALHQMSAPVTMDGQGKGVINVYPCQVVNTVIAKRKHSSASAMIPICGMASFVTDVSILDSIP